MVNLLLSCTVVRSLGADEKALARRSYQLNRLKSEGDDLEHGHRSFPRQNATDARHQHHRSLATDLFKPYFCRATPESPLRISNILRNPSFRSGTKGWSTTGGSIKAVRDPVRVAGRRAYVTFGVVSDRKSSSSGPSQRVAVLRPGLHQLVLWVRLSSGDPQYVRAKVHFSNGVEGCVGGAYAKAHCWTKLMGGFTVESAQAAARILVDGPPPGVDLWVTSASLVPIDAARWRRQQNSRIRRLRTRPVTLRVRGPLDAPMPGVSVQVAQVGHDFPWGGGTNGGILHDAKYQRWFLSRFNWASFVNEAKWYAVEGQQGHVDYSLPKQMAEFLRSKGVKIRGHNLFWNVQTYVQSWVQGLDNQELMQAMREHVEGEVSAFRGLFEHWDVLNEPLHGTYFESRLGPDILPWMFRAARRYDPAAQLFVNEYSTVERCDAVAGPEKLLAKIISWRKRGADVGGIGVESHFDSQPISVMVKRDLDQLAALGIPIWITELDFVGTLPKQQQADFLEIYLREVFSHPAVEGIMMWTTAQVPCSLYQDPDVSWCTQTCRNCLADRIKEEYVDNEIGRRYMQLRREWSTQAQGATQSGGLMSFQAYHGKLQATITASGKTWIKYFNVSKGSTPLVVDLKLA